MTVAAVASLFVGIIIGFAGQRSRMCFVGGIRDFILVRDTFLLRGLMAFILTGWVLFPLARLLIGGSPPVNGEFDLTLLLVTGIGGLGIGVVSILANGCPFRQHVLASQGVISSLSYLAGFYAGAVLFHLAVLPFLNRFILF